MIPRQMLSADLLKRTEARGGVVHLHELRADGISSHALQRLRRTELTDLGTGWFAIGTPTWDGYLHAAAKIAGNRGAAYGATAGALYELTEKVLPLTFLCGASGPRSRDWVRFVRSAASTRTIQQNLSPPRVGVDDTVVDLASGAHRDSDAIAIVTRAFQERRTTPERVLERLESRQRCARRTLIGEVVRDAAGIDSVLELAYLRDVERAHGLPAMTRQYVVVASGHRSDGAYPQSRALIELDGVDFHDPVADRLLDNLHAAAGWRTSRFGWPDVHVTPCATARIVAGLLGLGDVPQRCPRCPAALSAPAYLRRIDHVTALSATVSDGHSRGSQAADAAVRPCGGG